MRRLLPLALLLADCLAAAQRPLAPRPLEIPLPNGRTLTPTGAQTPVATSPFAVAVVPGGKRLLVASTGSDDQRLQLLDTTSGRVLHVAPAMRSWLGLAVTPDGARAFLSGAKGGDVLVFRIEDDRLVPETPIDVSGGRPAEESIPSGLAVTADGRSLWVARILRNDLVRVDLATGAVGPGIPVGRFPYRPVLSPDGRLVAVSSWAGATVSLVDAAEGRVVATVPTADHPCDLVFSPDGATLYVAEANRNWVAAIDLARPRVVRQISVAMGPDGPGTPSADTLPDGSTPNALALSPDGRTLYVANADDDAIAVVDLSKGPVAARATGFIPSGWYPSALALAPDGRTLYAANAKGSGSMQNRATGPDLGSRGAHPEGDIRHLPGSLSRIPVPSTRELAALTVRAYRNRKPAARGASPARPSRVIPSLPGEPTPIRHVVYVIRENRTYDQVLGDVPRGNGDPSITIFGKDVTPNAHALVDEFVLLDDFYCDAEVSADGHNWSTAAYATDLTEKVWPPLYAGNGFAYWFEGDDDAPAPTAGYLWDAAARAGLSIRNYGEFVGVAPEQGPEAPAPGGLVEGKGRVLKGVTCPFYPGFDLDITDNARVDLWLKELRDYVAKGELPRLSIVRLGNDHTAGTKRGALTPRAMVADNDLALGRLVEALSATPFWKETAVFVVEDDAQNGSDHVDAHRSIALVVSPYTRRGGAVDSTLYSTTSVLRTIELILGLPPLSQHDASATPMSNAFRDTPDLTPYRHRPATLPLYERNEEGAPMQAESGSWDLTREDAAPDIPLNEAIWKSVRGAGSVMPAPVNAAFVSPRVDDDDQEGRKTSPGRPR